MKTKAEQKLEQYLTGESPDQAPETPDQAPETPDQVVDQAARKSSDQAESTIAAAAKSGNGTAEKIAGKKTKQEEKEEEKRRQAEEKEEAERIEAEQQQQRDILNNSLNAPAVITRRGAAWLSSAPTPGGVGMLLLALIMFLWIIVPVNSNGDTRAKLLFYTLTGRTKFKDQYETAEAAASATGGSADFDNGGGTGGSADFSGSGNGTTTIQPGTAIILSPFEV